MKKNIELPDLKKKAFTCPNCSVYSKHDWTSIGVDEELGRFIGVISAPMLIKKLWLCRCENCSYISFWYDDKLAWPLNVNVEPPIDEMDQDIKELYNEARSIVLLSPKGACAILRLALQKLCNRLAHLDEKGSIDNTIKILVEKGLPQTLQQAMDTVRIVGNEAVHPGEINVDDNREVATMMFRLMNIIVEKIVVEPKEIDDLYNLMPSNKLQAIKKRDKKVNNNE